MLVQYLGWIRICAISDAGKRKIFDCNVRYENTKQELAVKHFH